MIAAASGVFLNMCFPEYWIVEKPAPLRHAGQLLPRCPRRRAQWATGAAVVRRCEGMHRLLNLPEMRINIITQVRIVFNTTSGTMRMTDGPRPRGFLRGGFIG